jgi:hypothetical protein
MWFRSVFDRLRFRSSRISAGQEDYMRRHRRWSTRLEVEALKDRCLLSGVHALFDLGTPAGGPLSCPKTSPARLWRGWSQVLNARRGPYSGHWRFIKCHSAAQARGTSSGSEE